MANQMHTVNAHYDPEAETPLTLSGGGTITLDSGDTVQWIFSGVPEKCLAFVTFGDGAFGPFRFLQVSRNGVMGVGNSGIAGNFPYKALILSENILVAESPSATVNNHGTLDFSPFAAVTYDPDARPPHPILDVQPPTLRVQTGGLVLWYVTGLPAGTLITFEFDDPFPTMVGPFSQLAVAKGGADGVVVAGMNFDPMEVSSNTTIPYWVKVRSTDGVVLASHDPAIEPLGPPPGS